MGDHYYPEASLKQFGDDGTSINILFRNGELKQNVNPKNYFQSQNILPDEVDDKLYGGKVDKTFVSLRQSIVNFQNGEKSQFNLASIQELAYILFNVCPRNYKLVGKMDFLADQVDPFENVFKRAEIAVLTPKNNTRYFVLGDNSIVPIDNNGKSIIDRTLNIPIEEKRAGIYTITTDADITFCMVVHPRFCFLFHYKPDFVHNPIEKVLEGKQRPIPFCSMPDSNLSRYNRTALYLSHAYVTGKIDELNILRKWKRIPL